MGKLKTVHTGTWKKHTKMTFSAYFLNRNIQIIILFLKSENHCTKNELFLGGGEGEEEGGDVGEGGRKEPCSGGRAGFELAVFQLGLVLLILEGFLEQIFQ